MRHYIAQRSERIFKALSAKSMQDGYVDNKQIRRSFKLAIGGSRSAKIFVANLYKGGFYGRSDDSGYIFWLTKAIEDDEISALRELGHYFINQPVGLAPATEHDPIIFGCPKTDREKLGCQLLERALVMGDSQTRVILGTYFASAPVENELYRRGVALLNEAVMDLDMQAYYPYALALMKLAASDNQDTILGLLIQASDHGIADASALLGRMYEQGAWCRQDIALSVDYYRRASNGGSLEGMLRYSLALIEGIFVVRDLFKAETLMRASAIKGNSEAAAYLANFYRDGEIFQKNLTESRRWRDDMEGSLTI